MTGEYDVETLRLRVEALERGPSNVGDWRALDAQIFAVMLELQLQLVAAQRDMFERVKHRTRDWLRDTTRVQTLVGLLDDVRLLRVSVQSQLEELQLVAV